MQTPLAWRTHVQQPPARRSHVQEPTAGGSRVQTPQARRTHLQQPPARRRRTAWGRPGASNDPATRSSPIRLGGQPKPLPPYHAQYLLNILGWKPPETKRDCTGCDTRAAGIEAEAKAPDRSLKLAEIRNRCMCVCTIPVPARFVPADVSHKNHICRGKCTRLSGRCPNH